MNNKAQALNINHAITEQNTSISMPEKIAIVLGIISFINFDYISMLGLSPILNILQMLMIVVSLIFMFINASKIEGYHIGWIALALWIVCTTAINSADVQSSIRFATKIILPLCFFIAFRKDMKFVLKAIYIILGLLVIANFITILLYPGGMYVTGTTNLAYENWLLGFKNKHIIFYMPLLIADFMLAYSDGWTWDKKALLVIMFLSGWLAGSTTTLICMVLAVCGLLLFSKAWKVFNARTYLIIGIIVFILIVIFREQEHMFGWLLDIVGKDATFSNRTLEWDIAIDYILKNPVIGNGYLSIDNRHMIYLSQSVMSAHNQILEYAFVGGYILVALYAILMIQLSYKLTIVARYPVMQALSMIFFMMLIVLLTEVYEDILFYALYFMLWNIASDFRINTDTEGEVCAINRSNA